MYLVQLGIMTCLKINAPVHIYNLYIGRVGEFVQCIMKEQMFAYTS